MISAALHFHEMTLLNKTIHFCGISFVPRSNPVIVHLNYNITILN